MIPIFLISHTNFRLLVELQDLDLDLGHLLLLLKTVVEILDWGRLPLVAQCQDDDRLCCNISPVLHGHTNSWPLFYVNFRWWHCFGIFRVRHQQITTPISPPLPFPTLLPRSRRTPCIFQKGLLCRTDAENFGSFQIQGIILLLLPKDDRPIKWWIDPSGHLLARFEDSNKTLHCFCPPAFLKSSLKQYCRS